MNYPILEKKESLLDSLRAVNQVANVSTLYDFVVFLRPNLLVDEKYENFLKTTILCTDASCKNFIDLKSVNSTVDDDFLVYHHLQYQVVQDHIKQILDQRNGTSYVQGLGYRKEGGKLNAVGLNPTNKYLINNEFEKLYEILGDFYMNVLLDNYMIFLKKGNIYLQITGKFLIEPGHFQKNESFKGKKSNSKEFPNRSESSGKGPEEIKKLDRNQIFYCTHFNRHAGFLKKFYLVSFGKDACMKEVKSKLLKNLKLGNDSVAKFEKTMKEIINSIRRLNLDYAIMRFCPLPPNYKDLRQKVDLFKKQLKKDMLEESQTGDIFTGLYASDLKYEAVADFVLNGIEPCKLNNLIGKSNYDNLKKKIRYFVELNRYSNLTVQELTHGMNIFDIPWMSSYPKRKNDVKKNPAAENEISMNIEGTSNEEGYKHNLIVARNKRLLQNIAVWIVNDIVIHLLRSNFYCTDKHGEGHKVFYYRKQIWNLIGTMALHKFEEENIKKISKREAENRVKKFSYPVAKLRILPKKNTFRPLMTFNRRREHSKGFGKRLTLNQILLDSQLVLKNLKSNLEGKVGFSVFDNDQIFSQFKEFTNKWLEMNKPKLFFVTLDIKKCYDSIVNGTLLDLFQKTEMIDDFYLISKYQALCRNKRPLNTESPQLCRSYFYSVERNSAVSVKDISNETAYFREKTHSGEERPLIVVDLAKHRSISKKDMQEHISYICQNNIIMYGNSEYFIQSQGVPQGLNVSSVLSSFYYSQLEEEYIGFIRNMGGDNLNLLMRLTDDYLCISNKQENVEAIIKGLFECSSRNKFKFNSAKIASNFLLETEDNFQSQIFQDVYCKWINKTINMETLEILPQSKKEEGEEKSFFSINVSLRNKNLKVFLKQKLRRFKPYQTLNKIKYVINIKKSLLLNHFVFYFNQAINTGETNEKMIRIFVENAAYKFFPFIERLNRLKLYNIIRKHVTTIIKESVLEFCTYCCFLESNPNEEMYNKYVRVCLEEFEAFFRPKKANYFQLHKNILELYKSKLENDLK